MPRRARSELLWIGSALVGAALGAGWASPARADGSFEGQWRQGPLKEEYSVPQWLPTGCGPAPVSSTLGGGDVVSVRQDGDELVFSGAGRTFRTNQCFDPLPTLVRDTHSRDPAQRSWRTRCTTPPNDPRRATMNTLVVATSDTHLEVLETGRYEIQVDEGRCIADVKRSRTFDLVTRGAAAPPPAAPPPVATTAPVEARTNACDSPGEPARLEVRPSRKLLRTGESFAFRAMVLDARGCATSAPTAWSVVQGSASGISIDGAGRVSAAADAPEGSATILATAGGRSARVTVDVASAAHYGDLLAQEGLNASGENDTASTAELATGSIGAGDARAEDAAKARRGWFLAIVGLLAAALGGVAVIFARRAKRAELAQKRQEEAYEERVQAAAERRAARRALHDAQVRAHEDSVRKAEDQQRERARRQDEAARAATEAAPGGPSSMAGPVMLCPTCRREYPPQSMYCPQDATRLVPMNTGAPAGQPAGAGSICPSCKRGYPAGVRVCPQDGEELVPYAMHAAAVARVGTGTIAIVGSAGRAKICPTCGGRFDGNAAFCGKDGTALVLIN